MLEYKSLLKGVPINTSDYSKGKWLNFMGQATSKFIFLDQEIWKTPYLAFARQEHGAHIIILGKVKLSHLGIVIEAN